ncbi:MAG: DNA-directed RNA polymerase I subunit rpa49 [Thelocarpon impressellum]|nr:MAG: DNA-directed RNA polymerase I subunit rpa49 [Thelocarpon impressellum]
MAELKRKRSSQDTGRPSKKVAVETPTPVPVVKVSLIVDKDEWRPVVATAPGLSLQSKLSFKPFKKARPTSTPNGSSQQCQKSEWLLHSSSHPKIDYTAREEPVGTTDGLLQHYVGLYDPQTGRLEVVEARKTVVRGTLRERAVEPDEKQTQTIRSLRNDLGHAFGTKKAQKAIASLTENAITPSKALGEAAADHIRSMADPETAALLESMAASTDQMASREELQAVTDEAKPRPKANLEARKPEDVYPVKTLVSNEELRAVPVKEWQDAATANTPIKMKSRFVSRRLHRLASSGDVKTLRLLRYLLLLLDFLTALKPVKGGKKVPAPDVLRQALGVPDSLIEAVRRRYSEGGSLNKWQLTNLYTHTAAIALTVDGYEVDMYDLKEDLKLENKDMIKYFKELGCRVGPLTDAEKRKAGVATKAEAAAHKVARLKLPLEFPKPRVVRARR